MEVRKTLYLSLLPTEVIVRDLLIYLSYREIKALSLLLPLFQDKEIFWSSLISSRYPNRIVKNLNYDKEILYSQLETKYQVIIIDKEQNSIRLNRFISHKDILAGIITCFDIIKDKEDCLMIFPPNQSYLLQKNSIDELTRPFKIDIRDRKFPTKKITRQRYMVCTSSSFPTRRDKQIVYLKNVTINFVNGVKELSKIYPKDVIMYS